MTTDIQSQLQSIDPAVLAEVVRQDQLSTSFEITSWSADMLSEKGSIDPEALLLFKGTGCDAQGSRSWSVVLKKFTVNPDPNIPIDNLWHWRRELAVSQSDLIDRLPRQLLAPRFYGTTEWAGHVGMWMENIAGDAPDIWGIDEYAFAARRLGQFNAPALRCNCPITHDLCALPFQIGMRHGDQKLAGTIHTFSATFHSAPASASGNYGLNGSGFWPRCMPCLRSSRTATYNAAI